MILDARVQHLSRITFYFYFSNDFYIIIRLILFIYFLLLPAQSLFQMLSRPARVPAAAQEIDI
jgi:hypothetical protein